MNWSEPETVLAPNSETLWEKDINRPAIVKVGGIYHLWYTGQADGRSWIGYATGADGKTFVRRSAEPVLGAEKAWEKVAVMCPHVIWDGQEKIFKMWYSGGEQYEPDAIGYAVSTDGLRWEKHAGNPVFSAAPALEWERHKVTAAQVIKREKDYLMFYIGFQDIHLARIGMAKSPDGITGWVRFAGNPVIFPTPGDWDASACYRPFAIREKDRWMLWYNGRNENLEQIGLAIYNDPDLGF
jgi:predicted GH43/DUF377 family glycosyl hydrolase